MAGALTGLLFIAVSVNSDALAASRGLSSRAAPNMITAVLVAVAGLTALARTGDGLYWLIPAAVAHDCTPAR